MRITTKKMLQPIQKLKDATKKVASGNFNIKLETEREDEVGELTSNFNDMVKDLSSIESLQKEFIDNVSHEIKTPITSIQGFAELLESNDISKEEKKEYIGIIKDNGIWMDEKEKNKIFTRFYQIDKSHSTNGSGLGLAIVKRIVELSNGKIDIKSEKNIGTEVIINLPIEKDKDKVLIV